MHPYFPLKILQPTIVSDASNPLPMYLFKVATLRLYVMGKARVHRLG